MLDRSPGVSLIIPAYNEQERIKPTLEKYIRALSGVSRDFEVIVVCDGSDATADFVIGLSSHRVKTIQAPQKLGKGGAIRRGFLEARYDVVGYVDADGSLTAADLLELLQVLQDSHAECVVASRWVPGSRWVRPEPFRKRLAGRGFNLLTRGLLGIPVRDTQCGAKFYRGEFLSDLLTHVQVTNMTTDVSFLFHARRLGGRIREVAVTWDDDPRSRFNLPTMVAIMFLTLVGIRLMSLPLRNLVPDSVVTQIQSVLGSI